MILITVGHTSELTRHRHGQIKAGAQVMRWGPGVFPVYDLCGMSDACFQKKRQDDSFSAGDEAILCSPDIRNKHAFNEVVTRRVAVVTLGHLMGSELISSIRARR